ncbi:MAG: aminotransferase class V-fold PLP-dependent enzyme [Armatimonadota bacterium]|nr:MAG: aminotransferase class V-fold PLP-dependent enzyme [Armatimonadota bacterium]
MAKHREEQKLALQGGMKAVAAIEGKGKPKIGAEEFMAVARRFGFSASTLTKIREAVSAEDMGTGPFLANYYSDLKETCVQKFERVAREALGVKHAIGLSSGTAALHAAFVAVGVGPGREVICPAIGFMATAAAVAAANGVPVFCDVDESLSMDPKKIEGAITPRTVAIAPTCVMGSVPDMGAIMRVARKHRLKVVEDCAQSCGASYKGKLMGTFGDVGCFSISAYKIVGGGEGGLLITDSGRVWERAGQLAECGGLWRPDRFAPPRYEGELFPGTNYRMSELGAAVDAVQLSKMAGVVKRFRTVKQRILKRLKSYRGIAPQKLNDPDGEVGYLLRFYPETLQLGRRIVRALDAEGVSCGMRGEKAAPDWHQYSWMYPIVCKTGHTDVNCPWDCPVYQQAGGAVDYARGDCSVADDLFDRMITIQLNQWYSATDCRNIARAINKVLSAYCTEDPTARKWL